MAVSASVAVGVLGAGASYYSANQQSRQASAARVQQQQLAAQAEATKPQASLAPDANGVRQGMTGTGQGGGAPGIAQTFLTGASGVDPNTLNLGKSTLLGS